MFQYDIIIFADKFFVNKNKEINRVTLVAVWLVRFPIAVRCSSTTYRG